MKAWHETEVDGKQIMSVRIGVAISNSIVAL